MLHLCLLYYEKQSVKLQVIIGIDANHYLKINKEEFNLKIFPTEKTDFTTNKKRSYIQAQLHKADEAVNEVKDHIITTLEFRESYVSLVDGTKS